VVLRRDEQPQDQSEWILKGTGNTNAADIQIKGTEAAGQSTLTVDSAGGGNIQMGAIITIGADSTRYTVTSADATLTAGVQADITVTPVLAAEAPDNAVIVFEESIAQRTLMILTSQADNISCTLGATWYED
jgi:hypothetical protein